MGRKIPAKKHRGVKDPLKQQALRLQQLKGKINAPPKDPDEQPVPRSLIRLFQFQNEKKPKKNIKKVKQRDSKRDAIERNPVAQLKRLPGESGRAFSLRINSAIRGLNNPMEHDLYQDQVEESDVHGRRMVEQRARREAKRRRAKKAKPPQESAGPKREPSPPAPSTPPVPEVQYERVAFGEVAHAPPTLRKPSRALPADRRRHLLLDDLLEGDKRERARLDAVAAYRALKARRHLSS